MTKTYTELLTYPTFIDRFEYLKLKGKVAEETFGGKRYLNQIFYNTDEWKACRRDIIIRDNGCDLGIDGREILGKVIVHHINPITIDDILNRDPKIFDPDNLITVSHMTHEAITYGDESILVLDPIVRTPFDTCPWRK